MAEENKEFTFENEQYRQTYWHTCSHIMAQAVKRLWPEVKLAIGPSIKEGWYYDMDAPFAFTPDHMAQIEAEMKKICKEKLKLERFELPREEAIKFMEEKNEPYKVELIQDLPGDAHISFYKQGEFTDLCAGPHLDSTGRVKGNALKLLTCNAAYWRGDSNRETLQRIYGIAFPKKDELDAYLERLEEAHAMGVRAVNPTWNHVNALSGTNAEEPERGLTPQGRVFVRKMERLGMLVDVSHLSDPGFWDVAEELSGPFFASHSNARAVFSHPRNLTDEQFTAIIDHNGVVGLNLYANFLGERADLDTAIAHLEHWLELGGERTVALGGDLDGCSSLPEGITGIQDLDRLWERLLQRNYSEALVRALFFENLMRVVSEVCTM